MVPNQAKQCAAIRDYGDGASREAQTCSTCQAPQANQERTATRATVRKPVPVRHDPICEGCAHDGECPSPCPPVTWINQDQGTLRERCLDVGENCEGDYKAVLADLRDGRDDLIEDIREMPDGVHKYACALLYAFVHIQTVAKILGVSVSTIKRMAGGTPRHR